MFRSIAGVVLPVGICFRPGVLGQRPNLAEPAQSDRSVESADDDDIHFS